MSILDGVRKQVAAWDTTKAPAKPKEVPDLMARRVTSNYGGTEAAQSVDGSYESYANAYRSYVWVRKAIDEKAKNIVALPVRVVDANGKALDNHVVSQLLRRGNDQLTMSQIWAAWLTSLDLGGEGPLEIVDDLAGNPLWLWPRRPDYVLVQASIDPERANYPTVAGYVVMPEQVGGKPIDVPPGNMIFTRYHNPLSVWRGLAPITAVRASIVIDVYAQAWSKTFFQKGARPDFGIIAPQGITATEKDRIKAEIMHQHSGNWFEPIVLEEGVTDIKPFSFPPSDMEWVQQRELTRNEIGAIFGVPDEVMGFGRDTYENFGKAVEAFWTLTLRPLVQYRDETLTHFFTTRRPLLAPGERIETDLSGIGVLQEDLLPKVEAASKLWLMGAPFNQLDEQLRLGIGPVPNGEFPNGKDPAVTQQMAELAAQDATARQNGQQGQQSDGQQGQQSDGQQQNGQEAQQGGKSTSPFWMTGLTTRDGWMAAKAMLLQTTPADDDAVERIIAELERRGELAIARAFREQAASILPPNADELDLWQLMQYVNQRIVMPQPAVDAITRTLYDAASAGVNIAFDQLDRIGISFDYTLVNTRAQDWARQYSGELIRGIDDTTRQAVQQAVERWYGNGEPLSALEDDLARTFDRKRARLIAQTETTRAAATGTREGFRESGVVTGLVWRTSNDGEKVCPICRELDGAIVSIDGGAFYDELPADLQGKFKHRFELPPAHPGCRCRISAQVIEP